MMFIDFSAFELEKLITQYSQDEYYSKVIDFLASYYQQNKFFSYTSGSTGEPKKIEFTHTQAIASAEVSNEYFEIDERTNFLLCLDIRFIGSKMMLIRASIGGAKITIIKPSLNFYKEVEGRKFDFISLTPLHLYHILEYQPHFFNHIGKCLIGSSAIQGKLEVQLLAYNFQTIFYESYAMTETLSHIAIRNVSTQEKYFRLLEGFLVYHYQEDLLAIAHPKILPSPIFTNDRVEITDSQHILYKGRKDNVINSGGIKISPESLEKEWSRWLDVDFILAGEKDEILGERLIMVTQVKSEVSLEEIRLILSEKGVENRYLPKSIYFSTNWSLTESLKPKREVILANIFKA